MAVCSKLTVVVHTYQWILCKSESASHLLKLADIALASLFKQQFAIMSSPSTSKDVLLRSGH